MVGWLVSFGVILVTTTFVSASVQYGNCDSISNYTASQSGLIQSPSYPNYYNAGKNCRYTVNAPIGYYLYVSCFEMNLPASTGCYYDKLAVSLSGDSNLADAQYHCGTSTFNVQTPSNKLVMALLGSTSTTGGRFQCQITAVKK